MNPMMNEDKPAAMILAMGKPEAKNEDADKKQAIQELMAALKKDDADGAMVALESFMELCEYSESPDSEPAEGGPEQY